MSQITTHNINAIASNYQFALEYCFYFKIKNMSIYVNGQVLNYKFEKKFYNLSAILDSSQFQTLQSESSLKQNLKNTFNIDDLLEIRKMAKNYQYIVIDEKLKGILYDFGHIESGFYSETKEGKRWLKLFLILTKTVSIDDLKSLEIFKESKQYTNEFFSYIQCNYDTYDKKSLYYEFFNEYPEYVPNAMDVDFFNLFYVNLENKPNMLIDKHLLPFISEKVLYVTSKSISEDLLFNELDCIIYDPKFKGYPEFEVKEYNIKANNFYEEMSLSQKQYSKLIAKNLNLYSNEYDFYKSYNRYLRELLFQIGIKKENSNWQESFKIDNFFVKFLHKNSAILSNFMQFLSKKQPKNIKKDAFFNHIKWDFHSLEDNIVIDIAASKDQLTKCYYKKKHCNSDYYVITEEEILFIEEYKEIPQKPEKRASELVLEDDLCGWYQKKVNFL